MQDTLAQKLRVLRARRGLTLREAEQRTGVDKDTLSKLERGVRAPYDITLSRIARGYGIPVEEILETPVPLAGVPQETGRSEPLEGDLVEFKARIDEIVEEEEIKYTIRALQSERNEAIRAGDVERVDLIMAKLDIARGHMDFIMPKKGLLTTSPNRRPLITWYTIDEEVREAERQELRARFPGGFDEAYAGDVERAEFLGSGGGEVDTPPAAPAPPAG